MRFGGFANTCPVPAKGFKCAKFALHSYRQMKAQGRYLVHVMVTLPANSIEIRIILTFGHTGRKIKHLLEVQEGCSLAPPPRPSLAWQLRKDTVCNSTQSHENGHHMT